MCSVRCIPISTVSSQTSPSDHPSSSPPRPFGILATCFHSHINVPSYHIQAPKEWLTGPLLHSISRPSRRLHPHPSDYHPHASHHIPPTICTQRAADLLSRLFHMEPPFPPASHHIPPTICTQRAADAQYTLPFGPPTSHFVPQQPFYSRPPKLHFAGYQYPLPSPEHTRHSPPPSHNHLYLYLTFSIDDRRHCIASHPHPHIPLSVPTLIHPILCSTW